MSAPILFDSHKESSSSVSPPSLTTANHLGVVSPTVMNSTTFLSSYSTPSSTSCASFPTVTPPTFGNGTSSSSGGNGNGNGGGTSGSSSSNSPAVNGSISTCSADATSDSAKEYIIEHVKINGGTDFVRQWEKRALLGTGGFAQVYEMHLASNGQSYAGKIIDKKSLVNPKNRCMLQNEIVIHKKMAHPNIVKYEHSFHSGSYIYIIMELCSPMTLKELVKKRKFTEGEVRYYFLQVLSALVYLHDNNVIHRDLKIGNMFLSNDYSILKLGDFGLSTKLDINDPCASTIVGTPNYLAPEILTKKGYSTKGDIWALGCCLYAMYYGRPPFDSSEVKTTYRNIKARSFTFPPGVVISNAAKSLINRCLSTDPQKRPSCYEILNDEFIKSPLPLPIAAVLNHNANSSSCSTSSSSSSSAQIPATNMNAIQPSQQQSETIDNKVNDKIPDIAATLTQNNNNNSTKSTTSKITKPNKMRTNFRSNHARYLDVALQLIADSSDSSVEILENS
jgi:polo-like kinase 1